MQKISIPGDTGVQTGADSDLMMQSFSEASLDLQDTKTLRKAWKSKINKFMQSSALWRKSNRQETDEAKLEETLETLLSQQSGQTVFREFLKSEFCEENLDFWFACEEFRTFSSEEELMGSATRIYEEFIKADAPNQVNLDFNTIEDIRRSLHRPGPLCFAVAQSKIYSLMENDSFPRFIHSEHYKVLFHTSWKHSKALKQKSPGT
ncbi:regulator of G-protein signaling 21-like [Antennarius striatus]|uniref:regulator of G-protein signaling 21-like n=1 Tax=Antennarius striatus TaxID=241820 RepID=UPI0035B38D62